MRTVIFDLDGTLADTSRDLIIAANSCFRDLGLGDLLEPSRDSAIAMRGGRAMLKRGLERVNAYDAAEVERQYPRFLQAYETALDHHTFLFPGVEDALERLLSAKYRLGICTNKPEGLAESLVRSLGIRDQFHSLIGADTLPTRKPDPAPYRAAVERAGGKVGSSVLIGDTDTDRKTGLAVNIPVILVLFGPEGENVRELKPEGVIRSYEDIDAEVQRLIG